MELAKGLEPPTFAFANLWSWCDRPDSPTPALTLTSKQRAPMAPLLERPNLSVNHV